MQLRGQDASQAIAYIRRESLDIYNRLHSIAEDIAFVALVHGTYRDLPLLREYPSVNTFQLMSASTDTSKFTVWCLVHRSCYRELYSCYDSNTKSIILLQVNSTPAYFKSTDGHYGNWAFNLRRPNLHLLPLIIDRHGSATTDLFLF